MPSVAIFGSSAAEPGGKVYSQAELAGELLSKSGFDIITGGYSGVMEAALKGASLGRGRRIGITTGFYNKKKKNKYVIEEIITFDYIDRLNKLLHTADGYLIMQGGSGTLLEFAAALALSKRGELLGKPIVCLDKIWSDIYSSIFKEAEIDSRFKIEFAENVEHAVYFLQKYFSGDISNMNYGSIT